MDRYAKAGHGAARPSHDVILGTSRQAASCEHRAQAAIAVSRSSTFVTG
jgi:hypothetical protein